MPEIPAAVRERLLANAKKVIVKAGENYDEEIKSLSDALVLAIQAADIALVKKQAYHIKGTASAYGWPIISAVCGQLLELIEKTSSEDQQQIIIKRYIKPVKLFATDDFKGRQDHVQPILSEIMADVEKHMK